ncbi:UNVERIFIED_CONTAM: hypothetical protein GTU68_060202 [Idotea baltica]|nr:hypothetical protein [Idotea baltica]
MTHLNDSGLKALRRANPTIKWEHGLDVFFFKYVPLPADGLIYWSRKQISTNKRVRENNQRSLLQPKFEQEFDAHAVEATSYALLVYLIREGVTIDQNRIVDWLNAMRMHDGGFISTVDTLIALQALTEYSYRARLRDITDMKVEIEVTGEAGRNPHHVRLTNTSVSTMSVIPIDKVWGMVTVVGRGAGQAILQLDVGYGVDWYGVKKLPPVDAFDMTVRERFSIFGNKSVGNVEICAQWINAKEREHSAAAVVEVENPTGYVVYQLDAENAIRVARRTSFPSIRDVIGGHSDFYQTKTVWFFDFIPGNETWCFEYKIRRWYPVANMTDVRMATIYEQYQPGALPMVMFNSSTRSLDVCEVCASYQCPYCPIYSHAPPADLPSLSLSSQSSSGASRTSLVALEFGEPVTSRGCDRVMAKDSFGDHASKV